MPPQIVAGLIDKVILRIDDLEPRPLKFGVGQKRDSFRERGKCSVPGAVDDY
jgi:hypothetical protein